MRYTLSNVSDTVISIQGVSHTDEYRTHFREEVTSGGEFLGLSFDELREFRWLETDDDGKLIGKGARGAE